MINNVKKSQTIINLEVTYVAMVLNCTDNYTRNQKREYEDNKIFVPCFALMRYYTVHTG